jgi:hypothetical protein
MPNAGIVAPKLSKTYTASGALDTRFAVHNIAVDGVGAMTLADPEAGYDGQEMFILATTANAHTVTYTGGFGGAGTGNDVATFGGAVGDSMHLIAYGGTWYITSDNVTVA